MSNLFNKLKDVDSGSRLSKKPKLDGMLYQHFESKNNKIVNFFSSKYFIGFSCLVLLLLSIFFVINYKYQLELKLFDRSSTPVNLSTLHFTSSSNQTIEQGVELVEQGVELAEQAAQDNNQEVINNVQEVSGNYNDNQDTDDDFPLLEENLESLAAGSGFEQLEIGDSYGQTDYVDDLALQEIMSTSSNEISDENRQKIYNASFNNLSSDAGLQSSKYDNDRADKERRNKQSMRKYQDLKLSRIDDFLKGKKIYNLYSLSSSVRENFPKFKIDMHFYSPHKNQSFIDANGKQYSEGDFVNKDLKVEFILNDYVIFSFKDIVFKTKAMSSF